MKVVRVTKLTDWSGKRTKNATKQHPVYAVLVRGTSSESSKDTVHYSCPVLWCSRKPTLRSVSLRMHEDEWEEIPEDEWPAEVCAGIAKRVLLSDNFRTE